MNRLNAILDNLLHKTGGWYVIIVVALSQLTGIPGAILGIMAIQLNAEFSQQQIQSISQITPLLLIITDILLLLSALVFTNRARARLNLISDRAETREKSGDEIPAWQQITAFTWRYGLVSGVIAFVIIVIGNTAYHYFLKNTTYDQVVYSILGGTVAVIATVLLATLFLDRMLVPARMALLPLTFEAQLSGRSGPRLNIKFQSLTSLLLILGVLIIGPIGYHQTVRALYENADPRSIVRDLQIQSIVISVVIVVLGLGLSHLISRSISDPTKNLIDVFGKVEQGDLSQRAAVVASDEIAELAIYFNRMLVRLNTLQGGLEKQVEDRTKQLVAINEVGSAASSILDPNELIERIVHLITDRFGHYYVAIFLLDDSKRWAELKNASGEAGKVLKQKGHRLEVGGKSMVGTAIKMQKARIALDVGEEVTRFDNPLLPYTRSEIALPLMVGDRVLGALDVQSTRGAAFAPQDINTLQGMANQVAVALENARLYQEAQANLQEMRSIQKQYLLESWRSLPVAEHERIFSTGDYPGAEPSEFKIPLTLRDQILGEIKVEGNRDLTPEERILVGSIANQATIALENARLLEESQLIAIKERFISNVTSQIWSTPTIDGIMQTAIRELGQILDAAEATIELELEQQD